MDYKLIVAREISRSEDLRGKIVALNRKRSCSDFATRYALDKYGLQPDQDMRFVQIGSQPARFAALGKGKIHVATIESGSIDIKGQKSTLLRYTPFKWTKFQEANKESLKNLHCIFIGQKLIIPPTVQSVA